MVFGAVVAVTRTASRRRTESRGVVMRAVSCAEAVATGRMTLATKASAAGRTDDMVRVDQFGGDTPATVENAIVPARGNTSKANPDSR